MDWVNAKIKALRKTRGLTQEEMAEKLSVQQATYSSWETGKVDLTLTNIERIAVALGVDIKAIWDPDHFSKKHWQPSIKLTDVAESDVVYEKLNDKDALITALKEEVEYLRQVNKALATSLNHLNDKEK